MSMPISNMNVYYGKMRLEWNEDQKAYVDPKGSDIQAKPEMDANGKVEVLKLRKGAGGMVQLIYPNGKQTVHISVDSTARFARRFAESADAYKDKKPDKAPPTEKEVEKLYAETDKQLSLAEKRAKDSPEEMVADKKFRSEGHHKAWENLFKLKRQFVRMSPSDRSKYRDNLGALTQRFDKVQEKYVDARRLVNVQRLVDAIDSKKISADKKADYSKKLLEVLGRIEKKGSEHGEPKVIVDGKPVPASWTRGWAQGFVDRGGFRSEGAKELATKGTIGMEERAAMKILTRQVGLAEKRNKGCQKNLYGQTTAKLVSFGRPKIKVGAHAQYKSAAMRELAGKATAYNTKMDAVRREAILEVATRVELKRTELQVAQKKAVAAAEKGKKELSHAQAQVEKLAKEVKNDLATIEKAKLFVGASRKKEVEDILVATRGLMPKAKKSFEPEFCRIYIDDSGREKDLAGGDMSPASSRLLKAAKEAAKMGSGAIVSMIYEGVDKKYADAYKELAKKVAEKTGVSIDVKFRYGRFDHEYNDRIMIAIGPRADEGLTEYYEKQKTQLGAKEKGKRGEI